MQGMEKDYKMIGVATVRCGDSIEAWWSAMVKMDII